MLKNLIFVLFSRCPYEETALRRAVYDRISDLSSTVIKETHFQPHLPFFRQSSFRFQCSSVTQEVGGGKSLIPSSACMY